MALCLRPWLCDFCDFSPLRWPAGSGRNIRRAPIIVVHRGVPSVLDSGLAAMLMQDGRMPDLETQALGAILSHFEPDRLPSLTELRQIAVFERSLFSHQELAGYLVGGPPPSLPQ